MLPEADFVFLDELLNANSAILNSLLLVLNERVFRRGRETRPLPTLMVVGASNHLPEDEPLGARVDRFLIRVPCDKVDDDHLTEVLSAGWRLDAQGESNHAGSTSPDDIRALHGLIPRVEFEALRPKYVQLVRELRGAGISVSDRRAVKLQRLVAASALLCGRLEATLTDLWGLRYIWDTENEQELLASLVSQALADSTAEERAVGHPRSLVSEAPDPEQLHEDMAQIAGAFDNGTPRDLSVLRDRLTLLTARCQWVTDAQQRTFLENEVDALWQRLDDPK